MKLGSEIDCETDMNLVYLNVHMPVTYMYCCLYLSFAQNIYILKKFI